MAKNRITKRLYEGKEQGENEKGAWKHKIRRETEKRDNVGHAMQDREIWEDGQKKKWPWEDGHGMGVYSGFQEDLK